MTMHTHINTHQVKKPSTPAEIDLDLGAARQELGLAGEKPTISEKARKRLSVKHKQRLKADVGAGGNEVHEGEARGETSGEAGGETSGEAGG